LPTGYSPTAGGEKGRITTIFKSFYYKIQIFNHEEYIMAQKTKSEEKRGNAMVKLGKNALRGSGT
jgi:GH43 family beta-xylosidase